jgi:hypothetical protein
MVNHPEVLSFAEGAITRADLFMSPTPDSRRAVAALGRSGAAVILDDPDVA